MTLPEVPPGVVADAVAALPARLRSKLDQAVAGRDAWIVTTEGDQIRVAVDERVRVTLTVPVRRAEHAVCDCLLAPRCLHRAAVLSAAPVVAEPPEAARVDPSPKSVPAAPPSDPGGGPGPADASRAPARSDPADDAELAAVDLAVRVAADLLTRGLPGAGAVLQAELLRAVHQARAVGLSRLAAVGIRLVDGLRAAHRADPGFRLAHLADDLRELLLVCHLLRSGGDAARAAARGTARRGYRSAGELRLYGLCGEPVRGPSGLVGMVTRLSDVDGLLWSVATVRPGDATTFRNPGDVGVELGEARMSHRELGRAGLLVADARASADRRLGHGRAVQAVRGPGCGWYAEPLAALWRRPVGDQAERWLTALELAPDARTAGDDLAFLDGTVGGADRDGVRLDVAGLPGPVVVRAPDADPAAPYVANLRLLAQYAAGHRIRLLGRFAGELLVDGLAIASDWLPDRYGGHLDLGIDQLVRADLPDVDWTGPPPADPAALAPRPPLHLLEHHLHRVVSAGRPALLPAMDHDLRRLAAAGLPTAASLLRALRTAAGQRHRDAFGRLVDPDRRVLSGAWLAAACYLTTATRHLWRRSWRPDKPLTTHI